MDSYQIIPLMSCMITMRFFRLVILLCLVSVHVMAQDASSASSNKTKHKFAVYAGVGPNFYFNNLQLAANHVNTFNYSFVGRIMWEPEHFLSLGLETGYYRLYTLKVSDPDNIFISNNAVPIQIVVSMKFLRSYYFNFSVGQSLLFNNVSSSSHGNFDAQSFSPGDFTATLGYKHPLNGRFSLGAEAKFFYSSRANDCSLALVFVGGYNF